jgi:hypothetical protein
LVVVVVVVAVSLVGGLLVKAWSVVVEAAGPPWRLLGANLGANLVTVACGSADEVKAPTEDGASSSSSSERQAALATGVNVLVVIVSDKGKGCGGCKIRAEQDNEEVRDRYLFVVESCGEG